VKKEIRIGVVGVGNCATALLQGIEYYRRMDSDIAPRGIIEPTIGGYDVSSIHVAAAFDVASDKVGLDLSEATRSDSISVREVIDLPALGVRVQPSPVLDGIGDHSAEVIEIDNRSYEAKPEIGLISRVLRDADVHVLINYLPVGSRTGTEFYARCALEAGCGFVNAIPVPIGRDEKWRTAFAASSLPLVGDDVKSQVGATIVHRALVELFSSRGYQLDETYQLNVGGNRDFLNMMSRERLSDKRISKAQAITDVANRGEGLPEGQYHISPSDYVPFLKDRKIAFIRLEGQGFAGAPIDIELRMTVEDSPNSAGVVVDAIRYAKLALDNSCGGYLAPVSAWLMKAPAFPLPDAEARSATEHWVCEQLSTGGTQ
jgi:myo-inositol-1-phosphate synthase